MFGFQCNACYIILPLHQLICVYFVIVQILFGNVGFPMRRRVSMIAQFNMCARVFE